jgi:hypothetical protein
MINDRSELKITDTEGGCVFAIKVVPDASRDRVVGLLGRALKVAVSSPPEKGAANKVLLKILAGHFNLRRNQLEIIGGKTQPRKEILAVGLNGEDLRNR